MDSVERKRAAMFIGTMIVAVMFVTSYLAFGNNSSGSPTTSTTTALPVKTFTVSGSANAVLESYAPNFRISIANSSAKNLEALNSTLSKLLANGSITNLIPEGGNSFAAYSGTLSTYQAYTLLSGTTFNSYLSWNATAILSIPRNLTLYYGANPLNVYTGNSVYQTGANSIEPIGSNVPVNILAVVYPNGGTIPAMYYVYNNNIEVTAQHLP